MFRRALLSFATMVLACKGGEHEETKKPRFRSTPTTTATTTESATPSPTTPSAPVATGPRYLRPTSGGTMVDAFNFPTVPANIVEQQVAAASSRHAVAGILRRFGLMPLDGPKGEVWIAKASLVDGQARERILVASFRTDPNDQGVRDEQAWIVFIGSTEDDRILKIGNAKIVAKITSTPVEVDAKELHAGDFDDVVATWSSCTSESQKACHTMRAWTMQRGYPEQILDVTGDSKPEISEGAAPHKVRVDDRIFAFDAKAFAYQGL